MGVDIISLTILLIIFLFSVVIHEVSHGLMAYHLGDPTAKNLGRLSLNPLVHLDLFGSIIVPGFLLLLSHFAKTGIIFGWAKPVPIDFSQLKDKKYGPVKVALAGPTANLSLALIFGFLARYGLTWGAGSLFINNLMGVFEITVWINLVLAIFNLMPIPPLDGSYLLMAALPRRWKKYGILLEQYGWFLLLIFIFFFFGYLIPVIQFFFRLIVGRYFF